ncbi:MAG: citrate lyase holo-[acyl-carrier protein] synthase [Streptococcaceae bacterium]|jgi:holo-ACP synthase|nr:citrate lyase holo-[acyl-carrier protein] synthase [Streptococcaceae bacterium]
MYKEFFDGPEITLMEMLDAREKRVKIQQDKLIKHPDYSLLSVAMNIPGPVKNSKQISQVFQEFINIIENQLSPKKSRITFEKTGPQYFAMYEMAAIELKKIMIEFEESFAIGRLFDLDVLYSENGKIKQISRSDLGLPQRKCLICDKPAKECGRNRTHTIEEMQKKIIEILEKD